MHDLIIKNGTVIDGSGSPMYDADIAVNGGVITEIGDLGGEKGRTEVDAQGKYVTPGFIDISNRSDVYWRLFQDPVMESLLRQGITTIIGGNSGASLAPIYNEQMFLSTQKWTDVRGENVNWETVKNFFSVLAKRHISMNFGMFVGHGTIRRGLIGDDARALSLAELQSMIKQIEEAMKDGALGVSLGLVYTHGCSATVEELISVAKSIVKYNALLAVHLRDEDENIIGSLEEFLDIVEQTHVRAHITHLKVVGQPYWPLMKDAIDRIDQMIVKGFDITFDVYPYTVTGSVLYTFLPRWVSEGGKKMMLGRLNNENTYRQAHKELRASKISLKNAIVSLAPHARNLRGKTLGEIAKNRGIDVEKLTLDLLLASEGGVIVLFDALCEENVVRALESPYSIVTSNSPGYTISPQTINLNVHPRSFGAFPRLLSRYVNERKTLSWELAIHKSTYKVAQRLRLVDRGLLHENYIADIAVIDPREIRDMSRIESPIVYAKGIKDLIINGTPVILGGDLVGGDSGHIIRLLT